MCAQCKEEERARYILKGEENVMERKHFGDVCEKADILHSVAYD